MPNLQSLLDSREHTCICILRVEFCRSLSSLGNADLPITPRFIYVASRIIGMLFKVAYFANHYRPSFSYAVMIPQSLCGGQEKLTVSSFAMTRTCEPDWGYRYTKLDNSIPALSPCEVAPEVSRHKTTKERNQPPTFTRSIC